MNLKNLKMTALTDIVPPGVVTGDNLLKLFEYARDNNYAIPGKRAMMRSPRFNLILFGVLFLTDIFFLLRPSLFFKLIQYNRFTFDQL